MKYVKWLWILYFVLGTIFSYAQVEREANTIYISSVYMTSDIDFMLANLQLKLNEYGIHIAQVELDEFGFSPFERDLHIYHDFWWDDESDTDYENISFFISDAPLVQRQFLQISPLLDHRFSFFA